MDQNQTLGLTIEEMGEIMKPFIEEEFKACNSSEGGVHDFIVRTTAAASAGVIRGVLAAIDANNQKLAAEIEQRIKSSADAFAEDLNRRLKRGLHH